MEKDLYATLKEIVAVYLPEDVSIEQIQENSNFTTELNVNSAHLVDIVLDVEDTFDITLENDDIDNMTTVADAIEIIKGKLAEKQE